MRKIKYIVVHCADTPASMDIGVKEIRKWHVEERGWDDIGYHYVIRRDGILEEGRPIGTPGAHVAGYNSNSIGICLVGGMGPHGKPEANFPYIQYGTLFALLNALEEEFPEAEILGHCDFPEVGKSCPNFNVRAFWNQGEK